MKNRYNKLTKCLVLDAIGMASAVFPIIDVAWAPLAAAISYKMFGEKRGRYTSIITFVEEILPVTDILPTFTIFWFLFDYPKTRKETTAEREITDTEYIEIK